LRRARRIRLRPKAGFGGQVAPLPALRIAALHEHKRALIEPIHSKFSRPPRPASAGFFIEDPMATTNFDFCERTELAF
jgi:hypothetical protein